MFGSKEQLRVIENRLSQIEYQLEMLNKSVGIMAETSGQIQGVIDHYRDYFLEREEEKKDNVQ